MSLMRLSGSLSARKLRISSGAGCSPVRSSETRRRNAASPAGGLGGTLSDSSRLNSSSSMKLRRLSLEKSKARSGLMTVREPGGEDVRLVANDQIGLGPAEEADAALRGDRGGRRRR